MGARRSRGLNGMEARKYRIIQDVIDKRLTQAEAATELDLSERQIRRLVSGFKTKGMDAMIHGLVGRKSNHSLPEETVDKILPAWDVKYRGVGFNFTHFTEKLNKKEKIKV